MARRTEPPTSFSAGRRWALFLSVMVSIVAIAAMAVMINYLGARHFTRMNWASQKRPPLSQQTLGLLKSITNDIKVTLYFDKREEEALYSECRDLLTRFQLVNPGIMVESVDYQREPGTAVNIKTLYKLETAEARDVIIFDCKGQVSVVPAKLLWERSAYYEVMNEGRREWGQDIKGFRGEEFFSAALLRITNPKVKLAAYLQDHGEHVLDGQDDRGYYAFKNVLAENNILATSIHLGGANIVPTNCDVLIIAGPQRVIPPDELNKVRQYLARGGRLLALLHSYQKSDTGLESLLAEWGVGVSFNSLSDPENTEGSVMHVRDFNTNHPVTRSLGGYRLGMLFPHPVLPPTSAPPEGYRIDALAMAGRNAVLDKDNAPAGGAPVILAVEKENTGALPTRIVVTGDSLFLANQIMNAGAQAWANSEFAAFAVNWLVDQTALMGGIGPQPIIEYKLSLTPSEKVRIRWIFLGAMPGGILLLGGLVWLRRRR